MTYKNSIWTILFSCSLGLTAFAQNGDLDKGEIMNTIALPERTADSVEVGSIAVNPETIGETPITDQGIITPAVKKEEKPAFVDHEAAARYDSLWMRELADNAGLYSDMYGLISEEPGEVPISEELTTELIKERLTRLNEKSPFNIEYNPSLERVIRTFALNKKTLISKMITASQFYFPMFEQALDKYDIPLEVKYLAVVESALNPRARSRVGATGLWQFMYATGKMYGLDVNSYVDERRDPVLATEAACKYLVKLYDIFGDWDLALAAYNSGPGNVNKAIRRSGGYKNYWNIRRNLPRETAGYVPAFLATMYMFEYAEEHGIVAKLAERPYFQTDTVHVKRMITFEQISKAVPVTVDELKLLNPSYKLNVIPKVEGQEYILRLPRRVVGAFVANEDAIFELAETEFKKQERPLPEFVNAPQRIRYRVKSGDYLGKIAVRYGVSIKQIKRWNGLRSNTLRIGQRLTIYPRKPVLASSQISSGKTSAGSGKTSGAKIHTVQKGDSLWTISRKYPGVTIEKLREWNGIRGSNLQPGTKLKLCDCPS